MVKKEQSNIHIIKKRFILRPAQTIILGFLAIILAGAFFLCLPISSSAGEWTNFLDALFTSVSAVCVTGLNVFSSLDHFSAFGHVIILLLIQIGGLGFMTATTFIMLLIRKKISFKDRLAIQNSLDHNTNKGIIRLVRAILIMTFSIELAGFLIFIPIFCIDNGAVGVWQALFLSVSAFCNAGFDLFGSSSNGSSLMSYSSNPAVLLTVSALVIIGGIGFAVVADIYSCRKKKKKLSVHTKIVLLFTTILLIFGTLFFLIIEYSNPQTFGNKNFFDKLLNAFFQSVTCRTAGFTAIDQNGLYTSSKVISSILMFIGTSPGSTGSGIKTTTFALIILAVAAVMQGRDEVVVFKHKISYKTIMKAFSVFFLGIVLILALSLLILIAESNNPALQNFHFGHILFESVSAFSTTGISTGITPFLGTVSKIGCMLVMFIGRVGLMNFGFAFFLDKNTALITYPESNISVG